MSPTPRKFAPSVARKAAPGRAGEKPAAKVSGSRKPAPRKGPVRKAPQKPSKKAAAKKPAARKPAKAPARKAPKKPAKAKPAPRKEPPKPVKKPAPAPNAAPPKPGAAKAAPPKPAPPKPAPPKPAPPKPAPPKPAPPRPAPPKPAPPNPSAAKTKTATRPRPVVAPELSRNPISGRPALGAVMRDPLNPPPPPRPIEVASAPRAPLPPPKGGKKLVGPPPPGPRPVTRPVRRPDAPELPLDAMPLSDEKVQLRRWYIGAQMPSPMEGFLEPLRVRTEDDGSGMVVFECSASSLRFTLTIPAATRGEKKGVKDQQDEGDDPICPRHQPMLRLSRVGPSLLCLLCGVRYGRL